MANFLYGFLFSVLFWSSVSVSGSQASPCPEALQRLNQQIDRNFFETRRDFEHYAQLLPQSFLDRITKLKKMDHWLDAGSGEGIAIEDFFRDVVFNPNQLLMDSGYSGWKPRSIEMDPEAIRRAAADLNHKDFSEKPSVTGVSFRMFRLPPQNSKLTIKTGRFFEEIPLEEFQKTDLISDVYGVASYTSNLHEVLTRYHHILKMGGRAYLFIGDHVEVPSHIGYSKPERIGAEGWDAPFANSKVRTLDGEEISLLEWLNKISGFQVSIESRRIEQRPKGGFAPGAVLRSTIVLEKSSDEFRAPKIKLMHADDGKPPIRNFEEVSEQ